MPVFRYMFAMPSLALGLSFIPGLGLAVVLLAAAAMLIWAPVASVRWSRLWMTRCRFRDGRQVGAGEQTAIMFGVVGAQLLLLLVTAVVGLTIQWVSLFAFAMGYVFILGS